MMFAKTCILIVAVLALAAAQQQAGNMTQQQNVIDALGVSYVYLQPDTARVIMTIDSLFLGQQQQQSGQQQLQPGSQAGGAGGQAGAQAGQPTQASAQPTQASAQAGQPGQAGAAGGQAGQPGQAGAAGAQAGQPGQAGAPASAGQQSTTQPAAGQQGQQSGSQSEAFILQNLMSAAQQLQQNLQSQGAKNVTLNSVEKLPAVQNQPHLLASVLFLAPLNNLQQLLQSSVQSSGASVNSIKFYPSEQVMNQVTDLAVQQAINNALRQASMIQRNWATFSSGQGQQFTAGTQQQPAGSQPLAQNQTASTQQTTTQQQSSPAQQTGGQLQVLGTKILNIKFEAAPSRQGATKAFLHTINNFMMEMQSASFMKSMFQRQGQQQGPTLPTIAASVPSASAKVAVQVAMQQTAQSR